MGGFLDDLSPEQRRVVEYAGRSLLVSAGPGSGKTRVVTYRVAHAMRERRIQPRRILAVTFTNRAAHEMSARVLDLVDGAPPPIGTFHWACAGLLRRHIGALGRRRDFRVLSPRESRRVLRNVVSEVGEPDVAIGALDDAVSGVKSGGGLQALAAAAGLDPDWLQSLVRSYAAALRRINALDLDDLPYLAAEVLRQHEGVRERCRGAIDELLVDEYQDTNPVQQDLTALLAPLRGTVVAVGDEDQAIYGWRHAGGDAFARFAAACPGTETLELHRSYRHCKYVARAASALLAADPNREPKVIRTELPAGTRPQCFAARDERNEAEWVAYGAARLHREQQVAWEEIGVLYRTNAQSRVLEEALVGSQVPYRVLSGRGFYARFHVQTVSAYLRLALDSADDAAAELLLDTVPGMGKARGERVRAWAVEKEETLYHTIAAPGVLPGLPVAVQSRLAHLRTRIDQVRELRRGGVRPLVDAAIEAAEGGLRAAGDLTDAVVEDFGELRSLAERHTAGRGTLRSLVASLTPDEAAGRSLHGVNLMSLHSAKGLEFRAVFLTGLEEGLLPHARSLQRREDVREERRLCYVGMTRARESLFLSYSQTRMLGGRAATGHPSRFIQEIGLQNLTLQTSFAGGMSNRARLVEQPNPSPAGRSNENPADVSPG